MTAIYTWDVFSTLDGYGSYAEGGDWGGYWSKQGPELLEHRAALFDTEQRMVFGATTFREIARDHDPRASIPTRSTSGTSGRCACRRR